MSDAGVRAQVLEVAQDWIDTPYQHQASLRGVGTDCLGLIRGVWRTLYGAEPEAPPNYTPDWAEEQGEETLLNAARCWLIPTDRPKPGDALLFRMRADSPCKHIGILAPRERLIHAYWGRAVVESWLHPFWAQRQAYAFSFPPLGTEDFS